MRLLATSQNFILHYCVVLAELEKRGVELILEYRPSSLEKF
jgi:hypothetical protein